MQKKIIFPSNSLYFILFIISLFSYLAHAVGSEPDFDFDFDFSAIRKLQDIQNRPLLKTLPKDSKLKLFKNDDIEKSLKRGTYKVSLNKNAIIFDTQKDEYYSIGEAIIVNLYLYQDREGYHFIKEKGQKKPRLKVHSSEVDSLRNYKNISSNEKYQENIHPFQEEKSPFRPILDFKVAAKKNSFAKENQDVSSNFLWAETSMNFVTRFPYLIGLIFSTQKNIYQKSNGWTRQDYKLGITTSIPLSNYAYKHRAKDLKVNFLYTFSGERRKEKTLQSFKGETVTVGYHHPFESKKPYGFNFNIATALEWYQIEKKKQNEFTIGLMIMLGYTYPINKGNL